MAQRYNTGSQVPSNALTDMNDNLLFVDEYVNREKGTVTSRLGEEVPVLQEQVSLRLDSLTESANNAVNVATQAAAETSVNLQATEAAKNQAGIYAEVAQSGIAITSKSVFPDIATGLAATIEGEYFQIPQGVGAEIAFITYLNQSGDAVESADWPGMGAVNNLIPLNATTKFSTTNESGEFAFAAKYDEVTLDNQGNVIRYFLNGVMVNVVESAFGTLNADKIIINGQVIDPDGSLPGADRDNLLVLSETSSFSTSGDEYEFNPKIEVMIDSEGNILFDLEEYIEKKAQWDKAYEKSQIIEPQVVNPLCPFTFIDAEEKSQIKVFNSETSKETLITGGTSNETNPRAEVLNRIVWQSDRTDSAPGGMFYAALPELKEHAYIARSTLVGWGHSFMDNARFMNKLCELTGLYGYNFGKSSMRSNGIAARQGGTPAYYQPEGGVIPGSGPVNLIPNVAGPAATFSNGALSVPPAVFAGVPGTFKWDGTQATFTRDNDGLAVPVPTVVPLYVKPITTASVVNGAPSGTEYLLHDECINVFWLGRNNIAYLDTIISNAIDMVNYLKNIGKRVVILPDFPGSSDAIGSQGASDVANLNSALKKQFPEYYCEINGVDLLQNFKNHHNPDFSGDVEDIENGVTPRSLRYDYLHPSQALSGNGSSPESANALYIGADVNAQFVHEFIKLKGWV